MTKGSLALCLMKYQLIVIVETTMLNQIYWLTCYRADPNKQLLPRIATTEPSKPASVLFPTQFEVSLPENFLNGYTPPTWKSQWVKHISKGPIFMNVVMYTIDRFYWAESMPTYKCLNQLYYQIILSRTICLELKFSHLMHDTCHKTMKKKKGRGTKMIKFGLITIEE